MPTTQGEREAHHVINGDGRWAVFARGHDIPADEVAFLADEYLAGDGELVTEHHYFQKRRLKNCGDHDWACEFEGEFHLHFSALKANGDATTHWTEIRRTKP